MLAHSLILAAVALILGTVPAFAGPACTPDGAVCVSARTAGERVELWSESTRPCSLTLTLDLDARGAAPVEKATVILPGPGRHKLLDRPFAHEGKPIDYQFSFRTQCGEAGARPDDSYLYGLPIGPGQTARIAQGFHGQFSHHDAANEYAVDFDLPENTPVYAARDGVVVDVVEKFDRGGPNEAQDDANVVRVEHADHTVAEYAHLRHDGAAVRAGQSVKRGQLLAYSGNTGRTTGPHLHFAVHVPVDGQYRRSVPIRFETEDPAVHELTQGREVRRP